MRWFPTQRGERQVDLGGLLEPLPRRPRLPLPLAAGQVDQVELARAELLLARGGLAARGGRRVRRRLDDDREDGVRPRRVLVHERGPDGAVLLARVQHVLHLAHPLDDVPRQVLDVHPALGVLLEVQLVLRVLGQQVAHLLVVDLQERRADQKILVVGPFNSLENVAEGTGNDAAHVWRIPLALHSMCFAGSCLTIAEYSSVVALEN
mmetsp:Transcript_39969/g.106958  ORF Transcript_39969/g.106958 Transcript_39969/m.106958 type:complete len:207 (-) Transcript_39969:126-746(-)